MRKSAILLGGAIVLAGCQTAPPANPVVAVPVVDPTNPLFAPGFLAQAASGDHFEIQSSQLALQMSQKGAVRNFASMLIADHRRMSQQMAAAARSAGLVPPAPALLPEHQAMLDQLRGSPPGDAFDLAFQQAQVSAHQQALQLMQNYAASGDVPGLRTVATQAVPIIQSHFNQAQQLANFVAPKAPPPPPLRPPGERG